MSEVTYDDNVKIWKSAYTNVLKVCDKYAEDFKIYGNEFYDIRDMSMYAHNHLMLIDWYEKYGIRLGHSNKAYQSNFIRIGDYIYSSYFQDAKRDKENGSGRYISWSDDDRQPKDEWLLNISFSTGAYIFGDDYDYQRQLFQDFFDELKTYKPDYSDTHNNSLYWRLDNAKTIYDEFNDILKKYRERNQSELKQREVDKLRKKLEKLEVEL